MDSVHQFTTHIKGERIAYETLPGKGPGIFYLGGFRSSMAGVKAQYLRAFCKKQGRGFTVFDYSGHGQSDGKFEKGTIGLWLENAITVFKKTSGPQIIIGSSMGGWIMLLLALKEPDRVKALIGVAAAPDFSETLFFKQLSPSLKEKIKINGFIERQSLEGESYPITWKMIEEARNHLVLGQNINIKCAVHLIHGQKDEEVPWQKSIELSEKLNSSKVYIHLIKQGDHRLNQKSDLTLLSEIIKLI